MRLITCLTFILLNFQAIAAEVFDVVIGDAKPLIIVDGNKLRPSNPGYIIEIAESVARSLHWDLQYQVLPFARQLKALENGQAHMSIALLKTPDRDFVYNELPIGISDLCIYKKNTDMTKIINIDDLKDKRLGIVNGYSYGKLDPYVNKHSYSDKIIRVSGQDEIIFVKLSKLLMNDRIDVFVAANYIFEYFRDKNEIKNIVSAGCIDRVYGYIAFSNKYAQADQWANQFDVEMAKFHETAEFQVILDKYKVKNWVSIPD